jgi:high-affinity iron transporter
MLGTAVIVFREVLEAALIVAIVLGASRGIAGRGRWVGGGVLVGLTGAAAVAAFAGQLASSLSGNGQALFNASILLAAVAMLAWHNVWTSSHGRQMTSHISEVGAAVSTGSRPVLALAVIVAAAVMREGSELVLFLWAIATGGGAGAAMTGGAIAGLATGVAVGMLLYRGLLRIPLRHFFTVVSWMVLLLAAGLAAQAAAFMNQAGMLPALGTGLWDTSWLLNQHSIAGQLLHILIGYTARPSGIQVLFYVVTLIGIFTLMQTVPRRHGYIVSKQ